MGRPINKKFLSGNEETPLLVQAKFDDGVVRYGTIEKQAGNGLFLIRNGDRTVRAKLANASSDTMTNGQMIIQAVDADDNPVRISKITSKKIVTYGDEVYQWGTAAATEGTIQMTVAPAVGSNLTTVTKASPVKMTADAVRAGTDNILYSSGNPATNASIASNGEIEIALRVGQYRNKASFPVTSISTTPTYTKTLTAAQDWNYTYSATLIDNIRGKAITDLYDVTLTVTGGDVNLSFELSVDSNGLMHFKDAENNLDIVDNLASSANSILQNLQRLSNWRHLYPNQATNAFGAVLGTFTITMTATRKEGDAAPVSCSVKAVIS